MIRRVMNATAAGGTKVNYAEARAVVDDLIARLNDPRYGDMTFGVLSLFREQIEYIQRLVEREVPRSDLERHRVICSTVDGFQGDERDVILYSWRFAKGSSPLIFAFTNGEGGSQRVNVALTRARHQAIHFISAAVDEFPVGAANVSPYLNHGVDPERLLTQMEQRAHRTPSGEARRRVAVALVDAGFEVEEDFVACGAAIDLLAISPSGARVAVFVDAEVDPHPPVNAPQRVDVHSLLQRSGWRIVRIPATVALPTPQQAVGLVSAAVQGVELEQRTQASEAAFATITVDRQGIEDWIDGLGEVEEIAPEDRADYHWEVGSVDARLHAGDTVFMSDFERELYDRLAAEEGLICVPQWPSRGKFIDLVITDGEGRRLAIEADGEQHHETNGGALIPEDLERQALLEEAGWVFHRVRHRDFHADPNGEITRLLTHLRERPTNLDLAARLRGEHLAGEPVAFVDDVPHQSPVFIVQPPSATPVRAPSETPPPPPPRGVPLDAEVGASTNEHHLVGDEPADSETKTLLESAASPAESPVTGSTLADLRLSQIAANLGELVAGRGSIPDDELVEAFVHAYDVEVPKNFRSLLVKFAWSAKGHGFVELERGRWIPGHIEPHPIAGFGDWTFSELIDRAAELLGRMAEPQAYEMLLQELYATTGRVPKLATTIAGKAIWQAQHRK